MNTRVDNAFESFRSGGSAFGGDKLDNVICTRSFPRLGRDYGPSPSAILTLLIRKPFGGAMLIEPYSEFKPVSKCDPGTLVRDARGAVAFVSKPPPNYSGGNCLIKMSPAEQGLLVRPAVHLTPPAEKVVVYACQDFVLTAGTNFTITEYPTLGSVTLIGSEWALFLPMPNGAPHFFVLGTWELKLREEVERASFNSWKLGLAVPQGEAPPKLVPLVEWKAPEGA